MNISRLTLFQSGISGKVRKIKYCVEESEGKKECLYVMIVV